METLGLTNAICCGSPDLREKLQINLVDVKDQLQSRVMMTPADKFTSARKEGRVNKKQAQVVKRRKHGAGELDFGLGAIQDEYEPDKKWKATDNLGEYGNTLRRYVHKKTRAPRAVLSINKAHIPTDVTQQEVRKQLEIMCKLDHPNIVAFREVFEDHSYLRLVYDWCDGGPFMLQLSRYEEAFTEAEVAKMLQQVLAACAAAHEFGVHHLDLGLFSIFLESAQSLSPIKVFGFGLAGFLIKPLTARSSSSTNKHFYAAPELFAGKIRNLPIHQRHLCDVWACGAILYTLVCGRPPFGMLNREKMSEAVIKGQLVFGLEFCLYSPSLSACLEQMLARPWQRRPNARVAMGHQWFARAVTMQSGKDNQISVDALKELGNFVEQDHARRTLARMLGDLGIADDLCPELQEKFQELDLNGDGTITRHELEQVASSMPELQEDVIQHIIARLDRNGNDNVDINEFIVALIWDQSSQDERLILRAFRKMDKDNTGKVTKRALFRVLRQYSDSIEAKEVSSFVDCVDQDRDGKFDYQEFMAIFPHIKKASHIFEERFQRCTSQITLGETCLKDFKTNCTDWMKSISDSRDLIQVASGERHRNDDDHRVSYSYALYHLTEFQLHEMLHEALRLVSHVPGYHLTKEVMRIHRLREMRNFERAAEPTVLGARTILMEKNMKAREKMEHKAKERERKNAMKHAKKEKERKEKAASRAGSPAGSHAESHGTSHQEEDAQSEEEEHAAGAEEQLHNDSPTHGRSQQSIVEFLSTAKNDKDNAMSQWSEKLESDRADRVNDPEYQPNERMYENLYWLVKVKSDVHWKHPIIDTLEEMLEACIEDILEFKVETRQDVAKVQALLSEKYMVLDDMDLLATNPYSGYKNELVRLKKGARLLPMASFSGKSFTNPKHLEHMESMKLPVHFMFAFPKFEPTDEKKERMRDVHMQGLIKMGKHMSWIVQSLEKLFAEVEEDLRMSTSIEGALPSPPYVSERFLKHCKGREVQADAATPRSNEGNSEEELSPAHKVLKSSNTADKLSKSKTATFQANVSDHKPVLRIERNSVLRRFNTQAHG